ncbi:RNase adapter RapZ [Actibacterium sp. MT2.3-13A]|uniref:RNase adapter RapZ n=1 Tax=Actibacterium sp. MT2.3-13A TaxID=2828332 RepID=UPI001BA52609|nr:RNase adapter RapZ [Actibacterium sp. MT2.3-13A]
MTPDAFETSSHDRPAAHRLVLITGPSGAGRSTVLKALEDLGYEVIDNLPLTLVPRLLDGPPLGQPLALGLDPRNRDFSVAALADLAAQLRAAPNVDVEIVFVDCQGDVLLRRFSETRRRHPLAPAESPAEGIARELDLLGPVRALADMLIDTSELTPHELRAEVARWFGTAGAPRLAVSVHSFSYKRGVPRGADMVFDCRFLRNPYWEPALRGLDGQAEEVAAYVAQDARFQPFFDKVLDLALLLLPAYRDEGKSHLSIAFGCTGGQHRSVMVVEKLSNALADAGWRVSKRHRELERRGPATPGTGTGSGSAG